jgi:aminoglycoside phosphotransferase (APT) family kinase protein
VAEKPEWNAWLMTEEAWGLDGGPTTPYGTIRILGLATLSLADLQIRTAGLESELLGAGAFDQRLHRIRADADMLFGYMGEAMSLQTSTKVSRIETRRLQEIRSFFEEACDRVGRLNIPSTIVHGDMNLGNLVFNEDRCQIIDWCEGYVGHPLVTFQHLLLLNPIHEPRVRGSVEGELRAIYQGAMGTVCDARQMEEGFLYMRILAAAAALYGRGDWLHSDLRYNPRRQEYARSVARHMDRAACEPAFLEAVCA